MIALPDKWNSAFNAIPLIAILRGINPEECLDIAQVLFDEGIEILEVPLNSPDPFNSICQITSAYPDRMIGAGTITSVNQVDQCIAAGCKLIVAPNLNLDVAKAATETGLVYCPGVATPTEAFLALEHGASSLKLFPAELVTPSIVKAFRAVLPNDIDLIPVGSITTKNMAPYQAAGANGFGIGSALYKPGKLKTEIRTSAREFVTVCRKIFM